MKNYCQMSSVLLICNYFIAGSLFYLGINERFVEGEKVTSTAYTCCYLQDTFQEFSCASIQPTSEFDTDFVWHIGRWSVPKSLQEDENGVKLALEKRNPTKTCKGIFRIHQNISQGAGRSDSSSASLRGNRTQLELDYNNNQENPPPKFSTNGSLTYKNKLYNPSEYCFDRLLEKGEYTELDIVLFDNRVGCVRQVFEITSPARYRHHQRERWIKGVFAALAGVSFLFMLANVIIYLMLRKHLNESGWTEFAYFVTLATFSALSIPAILYEPTSTTSDVEVFCYILSVTLQFFEIATYSSYLMITFDVHWMLRKSVKVGSYGETESISKLRLGIYCFLLLSIPLVVTVYGIILNHGSVPAIAFEEVGTPNYGEKSCFSPLWSVSEYVNYGIECITFLLILLSINMIFSRLSASTDVDDPPRVSLLSNMFYFTLTYWIIGLLQFAKPLFMKNYSYEEEQDKSGASAETFWTVLEGFGYAQGIIAFLVFVFNRKTLRAFRKKSGSDGTLREIFRHACCGASSRVKSPVLEDTTPMSPLMKSTSLRRSTVRRSHLY